MPIKEISVQSNSVAVLGFHDGSAGQIAEWFENTTGYHIACYINEASEPLNVNVEDENKNRISQRVEFPSIDRFKGKALITSVDWIQDLKRMGIDKVLPLTPDNQQRKKQIEACFANGIKMVSAIHPTVTILEGAEIEDGVWINAGAIIGYKAEIKSGVLINTGVQIDHHNVLQSCCQVDPGVITAGNVTLSECCHVHTGAIIILRKTIGENSVIGAGAVVITDIPRECTAVGVPAKVIKHWGLSCEKEAMREKL